MLPHKSILFADDTTFLLSNKINWVSFFDMVSIKADNWFLADKLKLNATKVQSMQITANNYIWANSQTENVKLFGICLDNKLNWSNFRVRYSFFVN